MIRNCNSSNDDNDNKNILKTTSIYSFEFVVFSLAGHLIIPPLLVIKRFLVFMY